MKIGKSLVFGFIGGIIGTLVVVAIQSRLSPSGFEKYYSEKVATHVSPHGMRIAMSKGHNPYILVDLRSEEEYLEGHIITAINVPAYKDRFTSAYDDKERIIKSFQEIIKQNPGKEIVMYCYSTPCMTSAKIGEMLAKNNINAKHLNIGRNEWKYHRTLRNHEHERETSSSDAWIRSGTQAGTLGSNTGSTGCPINNEFGC